MVDRDNSTFHRTEDYDLQITDTIPYYESFHLESLKLIKTILKEPEFWLDTGCGTGTLVQKAVDEFKKTNFILFGRRFNVSNELLNIHIDNVKIE